MIKTIRVNDKQHTVDVMHCVLLHTNETNKNYERIKLNTGNGDKIEHRYILKIYIGTCIQHSTTMGFWLIGNDTTTNLSQDETSFHFFV